MKINNLFVQNICLTKTSFLDHATLDKNIGSLEDMHLGLHNT